jgi:hypothetical protein
MVKDSRGSLWHLKKIADCFVGDLWQWKSPILLIGWLLCPISNVILQLRSNLDCGEGLGEGWLPFLLPEVGYPNKIPILILFSFLLMMAMSQKYGKGFSII